jgi:hypothetical protein
LNKGKGGELLKAAPKHMRSDREDACGIYGSRKPDFGDRYRNDELISTAFVESTVNQ